VLNAVYVWGSANAARGRVLLRIEDHDRQRSRPTFEAAVREDLAWLGFAPDEEVPRQSERGPAYEAALARLRSAGLVYACECSRADILARLGARDADASDTAASAMELRYPGTCAAKGLAEAPGRGTRVRFEPSVERFVDVRHGSIEQRPFEQCGDLAARDRDGNWTYQFAVTVDDFEQGVTLVVRGDDLLASTGRQMQLARLLGRRVPPVFLHHPLVMKTATHKLSKADRDTSVRDLRASGRTAADVIGEAARLGGLIGSPRPIHAGEAGDLIGSLFGDLRRLDA
jgi:glutamyl-tRNA synthetase/glutamyl-Q tRNA(Asp) synthetase